MNIVKFPDPILTQRLDDFNFENPLMDPKELEKQMLDIMYKHDGIGLAANQVGINARVLVMGYKDSPETGQAFFNPIIEKHTENMSEFLEGCLSFPGVFVKIKRPEKIQVSYQTSDGERKTEILEGMNAKCFLHEFDHLEGVTFKDRVGAVKWAMAVKKSKPKRKYK